jgi:hypothetical protein
VTARTLRLIAAVLNAIFFVFGCAVAILPESTLYEWLLLPYGVMIFAVPGSRYLRSCGPSLS